MKIQENLGKSVIYPKTWFSAFFIIKLAWENVVHFQALGAIQDGFFPILGGFSSSGFFEEIFLLFESFQFGNHTPTMTEHVLTIEELLGDVIIIGQQWSPQDELVIG